METVLLEAEVLDERAADVADADEDDGEVAVHAQDGGNLAAQAGVRYSIENPWAYVDSNLVGFANVLECCRHYPVGHLVYASSSSVYGGNEKVPFSEDDRVDDPVSLYAATKKSGELMASCYSRLYGISATGLRFFTVYGPWGRPDMSPSLFAAAIFGGTFGNFAIKYPKVAVFSLGLPLAVKLTVGAPAWLLIVISVFGSLAVARFFYVREHRTA